MTKRAWLGMVHTTAQLMGRRYLLHEELGSGGMGSVYRATDRLTGQMVALKHVTVRQEQQHLLSRGDSSDYRLALAQEFKTLASLRHPNIISVLDYGFDESNQPYFTMELLEGGQNILECGLSLDLRKQVSLLVQVLQALSYLHRRGIVHRDLKPDNVLVIDGDVKVLDFGLAAAQEYLKSTEDEHVAGTLAYLAPEMLQGSSASVASDLYAVGIILYQLIAKKHPFDVDTTTSLVHDIVYTQPNIDTLGLDPRLSLVLARLLSKQPENRYPDARTLMEALADASDQPIQYETASTRESFLQAAHFVGREAEMERLSGALKQAIEGESSIWLIGGESGVGKSRLIEELRTLALVQGVLAIRGGAVSYGSRPYQLWNDVLRRLVLEIDLEDAEASVLKTLVPDIETLIERTVPDAIELEPQAAQDRLVSTIEAMLRRQKQPLAIFLEDIQWAGSESILLLGRLSRLTRIPLMVIGNYRDEEMPNLPKLLPNANVLKLERLPQDSIRALSESMLGQSGRQQQVVDLLERETEGNVFFVVEVVRALAEEAGQLDLVGSKSLPKTVFAGGMRLILQRRLQQVPKEAFPVLQSAAVIGRQLDLPVLHQLYPDLKEQSWLTSCSDAAVLEVQDDRWRFAHDKLRESLLVDLPADGQRLLHKRVAEAIETVNRDDLSPHYAVLAFHWSKAEIIDKAIDYLEKAGQQALRNYANQEALKFFGDALTLAGKANTREEFIRRARWLREIGEAYWGLGNLAALRDHVEQALALIKRPIPASETLLGMSLLKQVGIQALHRLRTPKRFAPERQALFLEVVRGYKLLGNAYFFLNESNLTVYVTLQQLNLSERAEPSLELAEAYANMCLVSGLIPLHGMAKLYQKLSVQMAEKLGDAYMIGQTSGIISLYHIGVGKWVEARQLVNRAIERADEIGDKRLWESVSGNLAIINAYEGNFQEAVRIFHDVYASSRHSGNTQTYLWGALGQAENLLVLKRRDEAIELLHEALTLPINQFGRDSEIRTHALFAQAYFQQGDYKMAVEAADVTAELIAKSPPTASYLLQHYSAVTDVYLSLWENYTEDMPVKQDVLQKSAARGCKALHAFARLFPIGRGRANLHQGRYEYLMGKPDKAKGLWEKGLVSAQTMKMPYEEALLHYEIGWRGSMDSPEREKHLKQAQEILSRLGAAYDLMRVELAL